MAKITRVKQRIFGSDAGVEERAKIGSLAAGVPEFTNDPSEMQDLDNFVQGLYQIVMGSNSPAIEDINSLYYLLTYQLAYILQNGVAEHSVETDYHLGSLCSVNGVIYKSIQNDNINNPPEISPLWWVVSGGAYKSVNQNYVLQPSDHGTTLLVNAFAGNTMATDGDPYYDDYNGTIPHESPSIHLLTSMMIFLPDAQLPAGFRIKIKDAGKSDNGFNTGFDKCPIIIMPGQIKFMDSIPYTVDSHGAEYEDQLAWLVMDKRNQELELMFDGTRWWSIGGSHRWSFMPGKVSLPINWDYTVREIDIDRVLLIDTQSAGPRLITLPAVKAGFKVTIKDCKGVSGSAGIGVATPDPATKIDASVGGTNFNENWGSWTLICDGTDWFTI